MSLPSMRAGHKPFHDEKNFASGFVQEGFSQRESFIMEKYGITMKLLSNGELFPENEEEKHFVEVCKGLTKPSTIYEKTWLKYFKKSYPRKFYTLYGDYINNLLENKKSTIIH